MSKHTPGPCRFNEAVVDKLLNCQPLVQTNRAKRLWEILDDAGLPVSDQPRFFEDLLAEVSS